MTPANKTRLVRASRRLQEAVDQDDDAQTGTYILLEVISLLVVILQDFHFRPEVNS